MTTVIEVVLVVTILPTIAITIASAQNLSTTEKTILSLVTTIIVMGLLYGIAKSQGFVKGK